MSAEPELASARLTSAIEIVGSGSLSVIVPTPCASTIVALTALVRSTRKVSSSSSSASIATVSVTFWLVWPGLNVSVVAFAV